MPARAAAVDVSGMPDFGVFCHKRHFIRQSPKVTALGEPVFLKKDQAINYAQNRARFRSGEIRIFNSTGDLERTMPFTEADQRLWRPATGSCICLAKRLSRSEAICFRAWENLIFLY
jgi:hypothetical protein